METLKKRQMHTLHEQYRERGWSSCPHCGASLMAVSTPAFLASGQLVHVTFSVACPECGVGGSVTKAFPAPRVMR